MFCIEAFMLAENVYFTKEALYFYVLNDKSATRLKNNYVRNCNEFIDIYFDAERILSKYINFDNNIKMRFATSRFNHIVYWYFNHMLKDNMTKDVINICKNSEKLRDIALNVNKKELRLFRALLCSSICKKKKFCISILLIFKKLVIIK